MAIFGLLLWLISLAVFYIIIKAAVKNGVLEAHEGLIESVRAIERKLDTTSPTK
ncbi:MAG: hypothetical protein M0Z55_04205 [Peptococcaceae bacterium]|nr:hypothetical protein [Peptococcaceae bacterium]